MPDNFQSDWKTSSLGAQQVDDIVKASCHTLHISTVASSSVTGKHISHFDCRNHHNHSQFLLFKSFLFKQIWNV